MTPASKRYVRRWDKAGTEVKVLVQTPTASVVQGLTANEITPISSLDTMATRGNRWRPSVLYEEMRVGRI